MADRTIKVRLEADAQGLIAGLQKGRAAVDGFATSAAKSKGQGEVWRNTANLMAVGAAGIAVGIGKGVSSFMDFDKAMSAASAATGATSGQMDKLRTAAMDAGAKTQFSATQAAQGITELAKAGVSTGDILGGGLTGALDLAAAGEMEVGAAAETAASAMNQFGLKGADMGHIADLLANGANAAQGSVADMGAALNQTGVVAHGFGMSMDDTVATLTAFASAGMVGSDAGTSLKTMIQRLQAPTEQSQKAMDDLGLSVYDSTGKFVGMESIFGQLHDRTAGLTSEQKNLALATIFGADAVRGANIAVEQGAAGFAKYKEQVGQAGGASKMASALTDNLAGDFERLRGSIETTFIQTGSSMNGFLRGSVQGLDGLVQSVSRLPGPVLAGGAALTALALVGPKVLNMAVQTKTNLADLGISIDDIAKRSPRAASAIEKLASAGGKLIAFTAITQALGAAGVSFASVEVGANEAASSLETFLAKGADAPGVSDLMSSSFGDMGKTINYTFGDESRNKVGNFVESAITGFGALDDTLQQKGTKAFHELDGAMSSLVAGGKPDQAAAMFSRLSAEFERQGVPLDRLKDALPQYISSVGAAGAAGSAASSGLTAATSAAADSGAQFKTAADAAKALQTALQGIAAQFSVEAALDAAAAAADGLSDAVSKSTHSLTGQTEGARQNREAMRGMVDASLQVISTMVEQGATAAQVSATSSQLASALDAAGAKAGLNAGEVARYSDALRQVPGEVSTTIGADTGQAVGVMSAWAGIVESSTQDKTMTVDANTDPAWNGVETLAAQTNSMKSIFTVNANTAPGAAAANGLVAKVNASSGTTKIKGDPAQANSALASTVGKINRSTGTAKIKGDPAQANSAINATVGKANRSTGTIRVNASTGGADSAINSAARPRTSTIYVNYVMRNAPPVGGKSLLGAWANGGVVDYYADGGLSEHHVAQIAPAGSWRVWAEDETGGEAYIPLAGSKRDRSKAITEDVVRRFDGHVTWNADGNVYTPAPVGAVRAASSGTQAVTASLDAESSALLRAVVGRPVRVEISGRQLITANRAAASTYGKL